METSNFFNTLGKRVRILREDRDLKQTELAQELAQYGVAIGSPQISKIEAGTALPSVDVLVGLVRALNTTADYLLMLSDDPHPPDAQQAPYISAEADEVARVMDSLPADARGELLAIARRLAEPVTGTGQRARELAFYLLRIEQKFGREARREFERDLFGDNTAGMGA